MTITLKNFHKVPISDLIESVVYDIDNFVNAGFDINMSAFVKKEENNNCAVCLGGAAIFGFSSPEELRKVIKNTARTDLDYLTEKQYNNEYLLQMKLKNMAYMFDNIRGGNSHASLYFLGRFSKCKIKESIWSICFNKTVTNTFPGKDALCDEEIITLKHQLLNFSNELRKKGY